MDRQCRDSNLLDGKIAINVSARQLEQKDFLQILLMEVEKFNYKPEWLELEITEGYLMKNPQHSTQLLRKIRDAGFDLSIDDFGAGYSSLACLKQFPITKLKIDKSFISEIPDDKDDIAITRAIIALGKNLDIDFIAEGVETRQQAEFLSNEGCDYAQGYLYSKPLGENDFTGKLKNRLSIQHED